MKNSKQHSVRLLCSGSDLVPTNRKLDRIANESDLFERKPKKISAQVLLGALMATIAFNDSSCRAIALAIGVTKDIKISRVAVWRFLRKNAMVTFLELLIAHALKSSLQASENSILQIAGNTQEVISGVKRILIGDATSVCLHPSLHQVFPGSKNQTKVPKACNYLHFLPADWSLTKSSPDVPDTLYPELAIPDRYVFV